MGKKTVALLGVFILLSGCAVLQPGEPMSTTQKLVLMDRSLTGMMDMVVRLHEKGLIDGETVVDVWYPLKEANELMDLAWEARAIGGDGLTEDRLEKIDQLLSEVQQRLKEYENGSG